MADTLDHPRRPREHNLKDVSLELPRDRLIVFTGLSRLGQVDARLRHDLRRGPAALRRVAVVLRPAVPRPDGQARRRLHRGPVARRSPSTRSPPRATPARRSARSPRSTTTCGCSSPASACRTAPVCGAAGRRARRPQQIVDRVLELPDGHPVPGARAGRPRAQGRVRGAVRRARRQGFARVPGRRRRRRARRRDRDLTQLRAAHDRGRRRPPRASSDGIERRLTDSVETALRPRPRVVARDRRPRRGRRRPRAHVLRAPRLPHYGLSFAELAPRIFSFNSPYGACPSCIGLGTRFEVDPDLVVPDAGALPRRRRDRAVGRRRAPSTSRGCSRRRRRGARFDIDTPWAKLTEGAAEVVLYGSDDSQVHVAYRNRYGRERTLLHDLRGRHPVARARRHSEAESRLGARAGRGLHARGAVPGLRRARGCKPEVLAVTRRRRSNIAELSALPIGEALGCLPALELTEREADDRRAGAEGDPRAAAVPRRRRARLPQPRPRRRHAGRRRGAAHPARDARSAAGWSACSTSSTSRRSACTSATTTG